MEVGWVRRAMVLGCGALLIMCQAVSAIETGGYAVRPGYDHYPEYGEIYFETITQGDLREEPHPPPIPPGDLPLPVLFILGIAAVAPLLASAGKYLSFPHLPLLGGYSRISKRNLCENPIREKILQAVNEHPGISLAHIESLVGSTYKNLRYHLDLLEKHGMVVKYKSDVIRYFPQPGICTPDRRQILARMRNRRAREIMDFIAKRPGASRKEISRAIGISGPSVSWHIDRLEREGIVIRKREGNIVRHFIADGVQQMLFESGA